MRLGLFLGLAYATFGFRATSEPPRLAFTVGPLHRGMLFIGGYHIHHWMVCVLLLLIACLISSANLGAFALVMVIHGLSYPDAFVI